MNESILTACIAIAGTLLGTLLTGLLSAWSERRRREEEAEREKARDRREREIADESEQVRVRDSDAAIASEIAELFFEVRRITKQLKQDAEAEFPSAFDALWDSNYDEQLRIKIGHVRDNKARNRLTIIMEALLDFEPLTAFSGSVNVERFVGDAVLLGAELALALSRSQQPEDPHAQRYRKLSETLERWDAFLDRQQQERAEHERLRREFKQEEHATEAMLDIATEISDESVEG